VVGAQLPEALTRHAHQLEAKKMAAISGGHLIDHRVEEKQRSWQAWQRPTLPSLEA
jgi:hypothetical protein